MNDLTKWAIQGIEQELARLDGRAEQLREALAKLRGTHVERPTKLMSAEAREKISKAQKTRWAKIRKAKVRKPGK